MRCIHLLFKNVPSEVVFQNEANFLFRDRKYIQFCGYTLILNTMLVGVIVTTLLSDLGTRVHLVHVNVLPSYKP